MKRRLLTILSGMFFLLMALNAPGEASAKNGLALGKAVPALTLPDAAGQTHRLSEWKNEPLTLLFFCGCVPCHDFARLWSQVQQSGDLTLKTPSRHPATVVVFLGGADAARAFAAQTGLDLSQTLLLTDPSDQTGQKFGVVQCPRVFVVDAGHRLVYTNPESDGHAPPPSAPALVSRALTAWRRLPAATRVAPERKPRHEAAPSRP